MSSLDRVPELVARLDRLVPLDDSLLADWDDVVVRAGRRRKSRLGRSRPRRLRLAIVVALLFILLTGVATATYLLVRGNGGIVLDEYGRVLVVNQKGLRLRTIARCAAGSPTCAITLSSWSPDGERLAFVRGHLAGPLFGRSKMSLYVAPSDGGPARRLATCGLCGEQYGADLAWSPNGRWIAFSRDDGRHGVESLWVVAAAGGRPRRLTGCPTCADVQATWSPNGQLLLFARTRGPSERLYTVRPDGSNLTEIADGADPQWSPDGRRIAFDSRRRGGIAVANADGSDARLLFAETGGTGPGVPSWAPEGRKLVFVKTPGGPGAYRFEVWTINADGSAKTRLYHAGCCTTGWGGPIWSPDGRLIAFSSDTGGGTFVINADGTGLRRLSPTTAELAWQPLPKGGWK